MTKNIIYSILFILILFVSGIYFKNPVSFLSTSTYDNEIKKNPNDDSAYSGRAIMNYYSKSYKKAVEDFSKAIELRGKRQNKTLYYQRGLAFDKLNENEKAIEDFSKVIELDPKDVMGYFSRGKVYEKLGKGKEAEVDYKKAINLNAQAKYKYILK